MRRVLIVIVLAGLIHSFGQPTLQAPAELLQQLKPITGNDTNVGSEGGGDADKPLGFNRKCLMCKFSVSLINHALKTKKGSDEVDKIANNFCAVAHLEAPWVCSSVTKLFNNEVVKVLRYGILTPNQVCGYLTNNTCGKYHSPLDDWEINLNVSASLNTSQLLEERLELEQSLLKEPQSPYRVLHISDTHVDLKYKEGSAAVCEEPFCCQPSSTAKNGSQAKAGYWGTYGVCDVPMRTFESALKAINATIGGAQPQQPIDYIIWTGDIQPHDVWAQNKKSAIQVFDAVFAKIFEHLPGVKILPTLGNHEMVPVDSFSPSSMLSIAKEDSPVWLYKKLDSFWSHWLPKDTEATITKDGFYSTKVRNGLKVISLNTNFCHTVNFWLYINSVDPGDQLKWLVHELQISELIHEKVHIVGHIPPGADDCFRVWSKNYNRILRRFSQTVTGQFFGHTHYNEFQMFYDLDDKQLHHNHEAKFRRIDKFSKSAIRNKNHHQTPLKPISVGYIGPSITTFINLNPSFRVYNIDPSQGFVPTDFETIFMNLTKANIQGPMDPVWESAGYFSKRFNVSDTTPQSMHNLIVDIAGKLNNQKDLNRSNSISLLETPEVAGQDESEKDKSSKGDQDKDKLFELYRLYNSLSDKFNNTVYESIPITDKAKYLCKFFTGQSHDLRVCKQFIRVEF